MYVSGLITITVLNRCIECVTDGTSAFRTIERFCRNNLFKPKLTTNDPYAAPADPNDGDMFYIANERLGIVILHKSQLDKLKNELRLNNCFYTLIDDKHVAKPGKKVKFTPSFKMIEEEGSKFDWQNKAIPLVVDNDHNVFELQTGKGKTIAALKGVVLRQRLPAFITKPAYLSKWKSDITSGLNLVEDEDFFVLDSVALIEKFVTRGGTPTAKAYLFSSFAIDNFIKKWVDTQDAVAPAQILPSLGVDITVYDEAHELFRMQYWSFMALNANAVLDLSGTLMPDEAFLKQRYKERFPKETRLTLELDVYTDVIGIAFQIGDRKISRRVNSQRMYAHHVFENSIIKRKKVMLRYFDLLFKILDKWYLRDFQEGQKALFLFATREMCTLFATYLQNKTNGFSIYRYIQGDDFDEACKSDIIVSTHGKSGTAVDYVGLILNVIGVSMNASQKSLQMLGRTRSSCIERWGIHPKVVYPICVDIPKQVQMYNHRRKLLAGRVKSLVTLNSGVTI